MRPSSICLPVRAELLGLLLVSLHVLGQLELRTGVALGERVDEPVVVLRLVRLTHHRAVVSHREHVRLVVGQDLALVLVGAALVLAAPGDRAADLPVGLDHGAEHVLLDLRGVGQGRPHSLRGGVDVSPWRWPRCRPCATISLFRSSICLTHSSRFRMTTTVYPLLERLLASLSLDLAEYSPAALDKASRLTRSTPLALLTLEEALGDATSASSLTSSD